MTTTKQSWLKRSLAVLLAVMMVMSMGVANVFAVGTDEVSIPDANLKAAINQQLAKQTGSQRADDAAVTEDDMASLTELVAENAGITDLTGLEKAVNLETLDLSGNDLSNTVRAFGNNLKRISMPYLAQIDMSDCNLSRTGQNDGEISNDLMIGLATAAPNIKSICLSNKGIYVIFYLYGTTDNYLSFDKLKFLDLSDNDINGFGYYYNIQFSDLEKIDLTNNRVWMNENAGSWYSTVLEIGIDKFDASTSKSLTDLRAVFVQNESTDFESFYVDNTNNTIDLGEVLDSSISFKLQSYGGEQTMSGLLKDADVPVMIASPTTTASANDNCLFTIELNEGENVFPVLLTHANGETREFQICMTIQSCFIN